MRDYHSMLSKRDILAASADQQKKRRVEQRVYRRMMLLGIAAIAIAMVVSLLFFRFWS